MPYPLLDAESEWWLSLWCSLLRCPSRSLSWRCPLSLSLPFSRACRSPSRPDVEAYKPSLPLSLFLSLISSLTLSFTPPAQKSTACDKAARQALTHECKRMLHNLQVQLRQAPGDRQHQGTRVSPHAGHGSALLALHCCQAGQELQLLHLNPPHAGVSLKVEVTSIAYSSVSRSA